MVNKAEPKLNWLTRFLLTSSPQKIGPIYGSIFGLIMTAVLTYAFIFSGKHTHNIADTYIAIISSTFVSAIIVGRIFTVALNAYQQRINKYLGIKLTTQDRIDLAIWQKHGVKPQAAHLQPVLGSYISYLEGILTGRDDGISLKVRILFFITAVSNLTIAVLGAIHHANRLIWNSFIIFGSLCLMLQYFPRRAGKPNQVIASLNRRQLRRLDRMRAQFS